MPLPGAFAQVSNVESEPVAMGDALSTPVTGFHCPVEEAGNWKASRGDTPLRGEAMRGVARVRVCTVSTSDVTVSKPTGTPAWEEKVGVVSGTKAMDAAAVVAAT